MNVLGKIKSKKGRIPQQTQKNIVQQQQVQQRPKQQEKIFQTQLQSKQKSQLQKDKEQYQKCLNPSKQLEYIANTNIMTKEKETVIRQKYDLTLPKTSNSNSNSLSSFFQTKKEPKKSGVHFQQSMNRHSSIFDSSKYRQKPQSTQQLLQADDEQIINFDFLLSNQEKKSMKKSIHLSKGKVQDIKAIEQELKVQNDEVLCLYVKKWNVYGDIYMLEGQVQSLKRKFVQIETQTGPKKVHDRVKVKVSCAKDILVAPQSIGRIYLQRIIFLSESQAMFIQEYLLKTIQRSRKLKRN